MLRKSGFLVVIMAIAALLLPGSWANEPESATPAPSSPPRSASALDEQERSFAALLTGAVLEGTWQMTHFEEGRNEGRDKDKDEDTDEDKEANKEPELGEPRTDRYTIEKAEKLAGDHWLITARVQYADKDVSLPVPVRVLWAGDTPVITLDTMNLPMLGTYSARVMFHKGFYSGVWYGASYGGVMSGRIVKTKRQDPDQP